MLRRVDAGRKVFRFPDAARRDDGPLGHQRTWWFFSRHTAGAGAVDDWADECRQPRPKPRWQEAFRPGLAAPGRIVALRCQIQTTRALPFWNFGDGARLLSRW